MASRAVKIDPKKAVISEPNVSPSPTNTPDQSAIATRAYELWIQRGRPDGSDQEDWFRAEQELAGRGSSAA